MIVRLLRLSTLAAAGFFLVACASTPQVDPAISAALSSRNVNQATYAKVVNGRVLDYTDIFEMVQKGVPSQILVSYLQSTRKVYNFTYGQLQSLKAAGGTPQLLNYLTETQGLYGVNTPKQKARLAGEQKRAYYNTPGYQNQQPFAYNQPEVDNWYDSGYEESLYSPFSFN
ncbi:MAG: hypothetical protein WCQ57_12435 [Verrucomicrobiota bacterium]